jgi:hypothetical protein
MEQNGISMEKAKKEEKRQQLSTKFCLQRKFIFTRFGIEKILVFPQLLFAFHRIDLQ